MKGDFSRLTYRPANHYRRVLMQQGRVEIDADGNEQIAIDDHISATTSTDVIGQAGYPNVTVNGTPVGGFALGIAAGGGDLTISQGRMYVDGLLVENDDAGATLLNQPDMPGVSLAELGATTAGVYAVYLDVWERLITALDNPLIRETALGGPDTSVRTQLVWQVKLGYVGPAPAAGAAAPTCGSVVDPWGAAATGTLAASSAAPGSDLPCILPPETGYQSLQNQLYRVEIHDGGPDGTATFKWSRENGSVVCMISNPPSSNGSPPPATASSNPYYVTGLNTDPSLGLAQGDWVELTDDTTELVTGPGTFYTVQATPTDGQHVTLNTATPPTVTLDLHPKLRRWDQSGTGLTNGVITVTAGAPIELEDGVQVQFSSGTYHTGDYWLIPARTATSVQQGYVQWPVDNSGNPIPAAPVGITHHYATLGLVEFTTTPATFAGVGTATTPTDCRLPFLPLTDLPQQSQCACTIVVEPGPGWEQPIVNFFAQGGPAELPLDAEICFPVGKFPLSAALVISNAGNIRVNGAGWGTQIIGASGEGAPQAALVFENCESVAVRDLHAETSAVTSGHLTADGNRISTGPLTFSDCTEVTVEEVSVRCGSDFSTRGTACIAVSSNTSANPQTGAGSVRIRGCQLSVGDMQVGIQLIHQNRTVVEDNEIILDPNAPTSTLATRLANPVYLAAARSLLLSSVLSQTAATERAAAATREAAAKRTATSPEATATPAATPAPPTSAAEPTTPAPATKAEESTPGAISDPPATGTSTATPSEKAAVPVQRQSIAPAVLNVGNQKISITARQALASTWQAWLDTNAPKEFGTHTDAANYLKKAATTILTDATSRANMSEFDKVVGWLNADVPLASRGIVVGGRAVQDVHILNNAISGVVMGISVGVSHRASGNEVSSHQRAPDHMQTIRIVGNTITCHMNHFAAAFRGPARFGVFVGNADSLSIEDNRIMRAPALASETRAADAIRVVGYLGPKAIVRANHTTNFAMGVCVVPLTGNGPGKLDKGRDTQYLETLSEGPQWLVIDNVIENGSDNPPSPPFVREFLPSAYIDAPRCLLVNNAHFP